MNINLASLHPALQVLITNMVDDPAHYNGTFETALTHLQAIMPESMTQEKLLTMAGGLTMMETPGTELHLFHLEDYRDGLYTGHYLSLVLQESTES